MSTKLFYSTNCSDYIFLIHSHPIISFFDHCDGSERKEDTDWRNIVEPSNPNVRNEEDEEENHSKNIEPASHPTSYHTLTDREAKFDSELEGDWRGSQGKGGSRDEEKVEGELEGGEVGQEDDSLHHQS